MRRAVGRSKSAPAGILKSSLEELSMKACAEMDKAWLDSNAYDALEICRTPRTRKKQPILRGTAAEDSESGSAQKPKVRFGRTVTIASIKIHKLKDEEPHKAASCLSVARLKERARRLRRALRGKLRQQGVEANSRSVAAKEGSQVRFDCAVSVAEVYNSKITRDKAGIKSTKSNRDRTLKSRSIDQSSNVTPTIS